MKNSTPPKFNKRLSQYGAMVGALIGLSEASAQNITYVDIDDYAGGPDDQFLIDMDGDGTNDFAIVNSYTSYLYALPNGDNEILGSLSGGFAYPYVLSDGNNISSGAPGSWLNTYFQSLNYGDCSFGNWCDITDGYLGVRFDISGNTHYGWIRMDVNDDGAVWTIKDWAYVDIPDTGLTAGQETLSTKQDILNEIKVVALNKTIGIYHLNESLNYHIYNMSGQKVLTGVTTGATNHVIEAESLANGVYIVELIGSNKSIKKKVIL